LSELRDGKALSVNSDVAAGPSGSPSTPRTRDAIERSNGHADLKPIAELHSLEDIDLADTKVSDHGLSHLAGLRHVVWLDLSRSAIAPGSLANLSRLRHLRYLSLSGTAIGDEQLQRLRSLYRLKKLNITNTKATSAGMQVLFRSHPGLQYVFYGMPSELKVLERPQGTDTDQ
jgi:hypothetical protein